MPSTHDPAAANGRVPPPGWHPPSRAPITATCRQAWTLAALAIRALWHAPRERTATPTTFAAYQQLCHTALANLGISLDILGANHVPTTGGLVLMWNQESHLDHLVLPAALPRPVLSLYNNAVARTPLYGSYLRRRGHFHVDRTDKAQWRASIGRAADAARSGACIIVSPEGTRSWDGQLLPMKPGAFLLARMAQQPVVCITVVGGHERLPRSAFTVRPGRMKVVFGAPIAVEGDADGLEATVVETFRATKAAHLGDVETSMIPTSWQPRAPRSSHFP